MRVIKTAIEEVLVFESTIYEDHRGYFFEAFNQKEFCDAVDDNVTFVQDNVSMSYHNVIRGLHYQVNKPQGKLVRVLHGTIFDVAVDLRPGFGYGKHVTQYLSSKTSRAMWIPPGFAHGFLVLSDYAEVSYKVTDYRSQPDERVLKWNDPDVGIDWPIVRKEDVIISTNDRRGEAFCDLKL